MSDSGSEAPPSDPYRDALDAQRLSARIAAVTKRSRKVLPVPRADGTVFLRGRRRSDRAADPTDRRSGDRRKS